MDLGKVDGLNLKDLKKAKDLGSIIKTNSVGCPIDKFELKVSNIDIASAFKQEQDLITDDLYQKVQAGSEYEVATNAALMKNNKFF